MFQSWEEKNTSCLISLVDISTKSPRKRNKPERKPKQRQNGKESTRLEPQKPVEKKRKRPKPQKSNK